MKKGFTLVELLVVIAVIAVLAAIVVVAINPSKKIAQSRDAATKTGIQQIVSGLQTYFTQKVSYPAALSDLQTSGELTAVPKSATGASFSYTPDPTGCTTAANDCLNGAVYYTYESPNTACAAGENSYWGWTSSSGVVGKICSTAAPTYASTPVPD